MNLRILPLLLLVPEISANGANLLQPHHSEFAGDNGNTVGIRRIVYGSFTWRQ